MNTEFQREERYIVFKLSDVERYLTDADRAYLAMMKNEIDAGRDCANKPPFKGLIVESDWPEYEPTWKAIEARVTGAQPAPSEQDESVRKAWARFSHELNHSPDAPYPGMSEAFEQHFSQSFTDREWRAESATWAAAWKAAKRHEAQAQPAPSVPECPYPCGWQNLLKHVMEDGAYLARSSNEDEPVTENARAVTMRMVMRLRDVLMAINNTSQKAKP